MKIKTTAFIVAVFIAIQAIVGVFIVLSTNPSKIDVVKVNDLLKSCLEKIDSSDYSNMPVSEYSYAVFGIEGELLYTSDRHSPKTFENAISNKDVLVDIKAENEDIKGKLVIKNTDATAFNQTKIRLLILLLLSDIIIAVVILVYSFYVKKSIFTPFKKLKNFATRIAGGNLDLPLDMDKNNVFGAFTESFDIMRDELKKSRLNEQAANQSKKELVAKLSHDIKTPVASIKAVAEVLSVQTTDKKMLEQLSIIDLKANQIDLLITNLFNATIEDLQELDVSPKEHESTVLYDMVKAADYKEKAEIGAIPPCIASFDLIRLQQVFDNVIENSYKYADTKINVTSKIEGNMLLIAFLDSGGGVCEKDLLFVTNKFYRGTNAAGKSGAGLGLYISKLILNQMKGSFEIENSNNGFLVTIGLKI